METLANLTPAEKERLYVIGFYAALGLVHFLCVQDVAEAIKGKNWMSVLRQGLIEGMLIMLTYAAYIAECGKRFIFW